MKFTDLKKSLQQGVKNFYVLTGQDSFLLQYSFNLIKNALNLSFEEVNLIKFGDDVVNFTNVVNALNTMPMFSDNKLIYVNLEVKNSVLNLNDLVEYFKNANTSSVLVINAGENTNDIKNVLKFAEVVDCNRLDDKIVAGFVVNDLKSYNKQIEQIALQTLILYCLNDLSKITAEVKKLVSFVGDRNIISLDDVNLIVNKNIEFQIYEITDALSKHNSEKVYSIISELKNKKDGMRGILPLIFNYFRRLLHIALNKDLTIAELAKFLNVKEFAVKLSLGQSKNFKKLQLKNICDLCAELEFKIKNGDTNADNATEFLILYILNLKN